jgi:hypothetical protein
VGSSIDHDNVSLISFSLQREEAGPSIELSDRIAALEEECTRYVLTSSLNDTRL